MTGFPFPWQLEAIAATHTRDGGACWLCWCFRVYKETGAEPPMAVYGLELPIGNKIGVCAVCCTEWQADAAAGELDAPVRVWELA